MLKLPVLYPILDADALLSRQPLASPRSLVCAQARELYDEGCTVLQLRAKELPVEEILECARALRRMLPTALLIMNDRADLAVAAGFDGVHVGQEDLSAKGARMVVGPGGIVGISTHTAEQFAQALTEPVDYIAIGPVFETKSKENADPTVGLEGVAGARQALVESEREVALVAIGGIRQETALWVRRAGADSLAVISELIDSPGDSAREFFRRML
jgi:thiamine-phosphate pyrophosphorylase